MQNYFRLMADNSINRSFLFFDNSFGTTPENFFISLIKCVWSEKFSSGKSFPLAMCSSEARKRRILQYVFSEIPNCWLKYRLICRLLQNTFSESSFTVIAPLLV